MSEQQEFPNLDLPEPEIIRARRLNGRADLLLAAFNGEMQTGEVGRLDCEIAGISGDYHYGHTRKSGGREPWYERGTEMCNERQVTLVAADELALAAEAMGIARIAPEWIGANILVSGIKRLSLLPPTTQLFFSGGVTLRVDRANVPCKFAGKSIAAHYPDRDEAEIALGFPKHARLRRGLTARVEKPGVILPGEDISVHIPEQWIYRG